MKFTKISETKNLFMQNKYQKRKDNIERDNLIVNLFRYVLLLFGIVFLSFILMAILTISG